jgi:hypothetical protein
VITAFLILAEPHKLLYPYAESVRSLASFCDRIIINFAAGRSEGTRQFEVESFENLCQIAKEFPGCKFNILLDENWANQDIIQYDNIRAMFQNALDVCESGWFFRFDGDNVFFSSEAGRIREALYALRDKRHIVYFPRVDVVNKGEFFVNQRSRDLYAVNIDLLKQDGIEFRISPNKTEWCRASFSRSVEEEVISDIDLMPVNYDATFFTKRRLIDFWKKTCNLYKNAGMSDDNLDCKTDDQILAHYKSYIAKKRRATVKDRRHPEDISERIRNITPDCWGYDNFGGLR